MICLIRFLPHAIRVNSITFERVMRESAKDTQEIRKISQQLMLDYPDLPQNVRLTLEGFPDLAAERVNSILLLSKSVKGAMTFLVFNSSLFIIWFILAVVYTKAIKHEKFK
jgi:hypothetical protein